MLDRVWTTRDGRTYRISEMKTSHILNCIRKIQRHWPQWRADYLERLELELYIRSLRS